ncbi:MAG: DUF1116 domain-containing protein, partial [Chloroflexota bacterium]
QRALDVIPGLTEDMLLHAGAPIAPERMCGPMRGALAGALIYEGRASDLDSAYRLLESGEVRVDSCHNHDAVAPMAGVISPSMPVWVIENRSNGARAYSNLNEGPGRTLRYGANSPDVIERLRWMQTTFAPRLREAVLRLNGLPIFPLVAEALEMGDECHSRNHAALPVLIQKFIPALLETSLSSSEIREVVDFMIGRDYFFLNLTMAACKSAWLEAEKIPNTSLVTAFSRNGVEFAIRVQGQWFRAESPVVDGHYFEGFTAHDANRDIGDSAITEASGLGGFAAGGAPAMIDFIGGTAESLRELQHEMYAITLSESRHFRLPSLEWRGTPTGVDVLKVLETGIRPFITTGIAHREAGVGQVGAGRVRAPLGCFQQAAEQIAAHP